MNSDSAHDRKVIQTFSEQTSNYFPGVGFTIIPFSSAVFIKKSQNLDLVNLSPGFLTEHRAQKSETIPKKKATLFLVRTYNIRMETSVARFELNKDLTYEGKMHN